jgi:hypothetical protein
MTDLITSMRAVASNPNCPPSMKSEQQKLLEAGAAEIEGLRRDILRCDDACSERDKEITRLRQRVAVLEMVIMEELDDCQYEANQMIMDSVRERYSPVDRPDEKRRKLEELRIQAEVMLREKENSK